MGSLHCPPHLTDSDADSDADGCTIDADTVPNQAACQYSSSALGSSTGLGAWEQVHN